MAKFKKGDKIIFRGIPEDIFEVVGVGYLFGDNTRAFDYELKRYLTDRVEDWDGQFIDEDCVLAVRPCKIWRELNV